MSLGYDFSALRSTFGHRNFAVFTAGNGMSLVGSWVQRVAVGWVTWDMTHSAAWLGAVSMAEFLPVILLAPLTGVLADRFDRRRIAVVGQILATLQAAALAVLTLTGHITPILMLVLQIISGLIQPLIQTARLVLVPTLVPRENVGSAVAITSMIFNTARIIGPVISGVLIAAVGAGYSFAFNALSYLFVIQALRSLKLPAHQPPVRRHVSLLPGIWADFKEGWRYTFTHPTLKWVIPVVMTACTLTWPVADLLAGIADQEFGRAVGGLAAFTSAQGIGAILGALFLAQRKESAGIDLIFVRGVVLNGICVALFAVTKNFWLAVPLFAVNGMFMVMTGAGSQTVIQTHAAEHMRGRALSIWYTLTRTGLAVGALLLGILSSVFGFTWPIFAAGAITSAAAYLIWRRRDKTPSAGSP
jgi:MFS family permease